MSKLSPAYRQDEPDELPDGLKEYLDAHFLHKLANLEVPHPKILVVYSGGNAVGKSTLSELISRQLHAIVLENDAVKACLLEFDAAMSRDDLNTLTWSYTIDLYGRLAQVTNNGLLVRDGVIDWYYDRILPIFEKQAYELFVIAFDVSPAKQLELLRARGDKLTVNVDRLMTIREDHAIHTKRFRQAYTPDIILTDETLFDHSSVIQKLKDRFRL